jgi:hypothetical protein
MRRLAGLPVIICLLITCATPLRAADYPAPVEADFVMHDVHFSSGEILP